MNYVRVEGCIYRFKSKRRYVEWLKSCIESMERSEDPPLPRNHGAECVAYYAPEIVDWTEDDFRDHLEKVTS